MTKVQSPSASWARESLRDTMVPVTTAQLDWMTSRLGLSTPELGLDLQAGSELAESPVRMPPRANPSTASSASGASHLPLRTIAASPNCLPPSTAHEGSMPRNAHRPELASRMPPKGWYVRDPPKDPP